MLATLVDLVQRDGLGKLDDDQLTGVLQAAGRLAAWSAAAKLTAVSALAARREQAGRVSGDWRPFEHADDEIAVALTLTRRSAGRLLDLALELDRLPLTRAALAAGLIDERRAEVIAEELSGLDDADAAAVEKLIIGAAAGLTTGQLRALVRRAVLSADPKAARRRKEKALRDARVEMFPETAGTAALAGRDLPPAAVLAADKHLTALAQAMKAAGQPGTLDILRAWAYLHLLSGKPAATLLHTSHPPPARHPRRRPPAHRPRRRRPGRRRVPPAARRVAPRAAPGGRRRAAAPRQPGAPRAARQRRAAADSQPPGGTGPQGVPSGPDAGTNFPAAPGPGGDRPGPGAPGPGPDGVPAPGGLRGTVNLTMPLSAWLGWTQAPGDVPGYGPIDAEDSRTLARQLARPGNQWCVTLTNPAGHPVAHACARHGPGAKTSRPAPRPREPPAPPVPAPAPHRARPRHRASPGCQASPATPAPDWLRGLTFTTLETADLHPPAPITRLPAQPRPAPPHLHPQPHLHRPRMPTGRHPLRPRPRDPLRPGRPDLRMQPSPRLPPQPPHQASPRLDPHQPRARHPHLDHPRKPHPHHHPRAVLGMNALHVLTRKD